MAKQTESKGFAVKMKLDRETKGAVRYQELDDHGGDAGAWAKLGTQYIRKTAFPQGTGFPQVINVTVSY